MASHTQPSAVDLLNNSNDALDLKNYSMNYMMALGIIAVIVTITFAAIKFFLPGSEPFHQAIKVINAQETLVQKVAYELSVIAQVKNKQAFDDHILNLKQHVLALQDYHQGLLYGNTTLGLKALKSQAVKDVYYHPSTNLDKVMTDFLVSAKVLSQLSLTDVRENTEVTQRMQQLATAVLPDLFGKAKAAYQEELDNLSTVESLLIMVLWVTFMASIFFAGFFIFRPLGIRLFQTVERQKKSWYQMLAIKKKVEAEKGLLEKSLYRYQATLNVTNDAMLIFNKDTREIQFNQQFVDLWGLPNQVLLQPTPEKITELLGSKIRNLSEPQDIVFSFDTFSRNPQTANIVMQDGKYVECYIRPIIAGEQVIGKAWAFLEVTRHIQLAKKYAEQSRRYLDILNSIGDGVVVTDESGKLVHTNPAAKEMLGISSEAGSGETWYRGIGVYDAQSEQPLAETDLPFLRATSGETVDDMDLLINGGQENEKKRINATARPVKDEKGQVKGGVVIVRQNAAKSLMQPTQPRDDTFDQFLESVHEGVLFINADLMISDRYSKSLVNILGNEVLQHKKALDFFKCIVPPDMVGVMDDYLKLIFHSVVTDRYVEELNPVRELEYEIDDPDRGWITRHLEFSFSRMIKDEKVNSLSVTVRDVTKQVASVKKLRRSQAKIQKQIDLLFRVIHVDPSLLEKFVEECAGEIANIHFILKRDNFREKLADNLLKISRSLVGIKENAAFLDLRVFEEKAGKFEKYILLLQDKPELTNQESGELNNLLDDLHNSLDEVKHIIDHLINKLKVRFRGKREEECRRFLGSIESYIQRISREAGKKVQVDFSRFNALEIPFEERQSVREVLIELLKQVIHKSIEAPQVRKNAGKTPTALIQLHSVKSNEKAYEFSLRDDGSGIPMLESVSEASLSPVKNGNGNGDHLQQTASGLVLNQRFFGGLKDKENSALTAEFHAVQQKVKKMGGKIHAFSQKGEFSEFYISIPNKSKSEAKNKLNVLVSGKSNKGIADG